MATHQHTEPQTDPLEIIYQDADYVAIDKPAGLLVHRSPLDKHATEFAVQKLRDQIGRTVNPCHRLDRPTSGVLLFALNTEATRSAQELFIEHRASKTYHALVRGWLDGEGIIDYDLRNEEKPDKVQSAVTAYRCLNQCSVETPVGRYPRGRFSLMELQPRTGRTHQLRRHMKHLRHPILGDTRHGDGAQNQFLRSYCGQQLLMLRAMRLQMPHPMREGETLDIRVGVSTEFDTVLRSLGLQAMTHG